MSPELSQKLAAAVGSMPAFPRRAQRTLDMTRDLATPPEELVEVVARLGEPTPLFEQAEQAEQARIFSRVEA